MPTMDHDYLVEIQVNDIGRISYELIAELSKALDDADDGGKVALYFHLIGQSSSNNALHWPVQNDVQLFNKWEQVLRRVERSPSPSIALVEKACSPVTLELLLVIDRRLAIDSFSLQPLLKNRTIWPGMSLYRLCRQIGEARARKFYLDNAILTAARALEFNVVDEVIDQKRSHLAEIERFCKHAPLRDFAICRRLMQESSSTSFEDALGSHLAACDRMLKQHERAIVGG